MKRNPFKTIWIGILLFVSVFCCAVAVGCNKNRGPIILDTPTNFRVEDNVLIWDEVEHAQGYDFYSMGIEGELPRNYIDLNEFPWYEPFEVEVLAIGDGVNYLDSYWGKYTCQLVDHAYDFEFELTDDGLGYRFVIYYGMKFEEELYIPDEYEGLPVKEIVRKDISYSDMLKKIHLPASLEKIGAGTFVGFTSLESIEIPKNVATIESGTFSGCTALKSITLNEGLESIGENAFKGCTALRVALFPSTLQTIEKFAFSGCIRLVTVEFSSAVEIKHNAFSDCASLANLQFAEGVSMGTSAFENCTALRQLQFPKDVSIGNATFKGCTALESIACDEGVSIHSAPIMGVTFEGCTELKRADIAKCAYIGHCAFFGCTALTDINFPEDPSVYVPNAFVTTGWYESQPDGYIIVNGDTLFQYKGEIPNGGVIDDFPAQIKKIGGLAFTNLGTWMTEGSNLVSIEIPDGVQLAGKEIFYNCRSLQRVRLPNDLTVIPEATFEYCFALESIEIPAGITAIGEVAFGCCYALQSVVIPEGVTSIENWTFWNCTSLTEVTLPSTLEILGKHAFQGCSALAEITLPSTLKEIGRWAFDDCSSLKKLHFPDSVQTSELTSIPSSVQEVILPVSMNHLTWFETDTVVYYRGSEARWEEDFTNVRGGIWYFYVEDEADLPADGGNYWHFDSDGKTPIVW